MADKMAELVAALERLSPADLRLVERFVDFLAEEQAKEERT
ncbi:hypothetical protein ES708_23968 [subsurface metagenome]